MSEAFVEDRRIRTWIQEGQADEGSRWRLIAKAQFMRYRRNWVFWTLVAVGVLFTVSNILSPFEGMREGGGIRLYTIIGTYAVPAVWILAAALLLAAAPAVADDIRFDAPLFYFSRPLLTRDYLIGKLAFIFALLAMLVLPAALAVTLVGTATWGADGPAPPDPMDYSGRPDRYERAVADHQSYLAEWRASSMDNFGDWLLTSTVLLVGTIVSLLFLAALTLAISSYTQRGWHAAIALIVVMTALGIIGISVGDLLVEGAAVSAFSPVAWPYAATVLPLEVYYLEPGGDPWGHYKGAGVATTVAYIGMIASTLGLLALTERRLRTLGGAL